MTTTAERVERRSSGPAAPGWVVIALRELSALWRGGRILVLIIPFSMVLSAISYLLATNNELNLIPPKEMVLLVLQVSLAVSILITLILGANAISGMRENGTLESLLVTPVSRQQIVLGKFLAALSPGPSCLPSPPLRGDTLPRRPLLLALVVGVRPRGQPARDPLRGLRPARQHLLELQQVEPVGEPGSPSPVHVVHPVAGHHADGQHRAVVQAHQPDGVDVALHREGARQQQDDLRDDQHYGAGRQLALVAALADGAGTGPALRLQAKAKPRRKAGPRRDPGPVSQKAVGSPGGLLAGPGRLPLVHAGRPRPERGEAGRRDLDRQVLRDAKDRRHIQLHHQGKEQRTQPAIRATGGCHEHSKPRKRRAGRPGGLVPGATAGPGPARARAGFRVALGGGPDP
ncbi:ABC transporter permease subunit [Rubrobacter tropicus]|uniref:ABC transporter permease subunit n=1 Tax=Rubrobacter tropicus TaxID=2653851 RepID=A0A6G8QFB7_9ACTN|nr:ABC transporter permease subunit [Rubrobacter tropicus]